MFAITGLDAGALKAATQDKLTLAGILDFLLANEADLLDFCAYAEIDPREPARAQQTLTGETYFC